MVDLEKRDTASGLKLECEIRAHIHLRFAFYFRGFMRVVGPNFKVEREASAPIIPFIWTDYELEIQQIVRIRKFRRASLGQVQLIQV